MLSGTKPWRQGDYLRREVELSDATQAGTGHPVAPRTRVVLVYQETVFEDRFIRACGIFAAVSIIEAVLLLARGQLRRL